MRSTNTDTLRSNSSSGSRKIVRHRVWDRVLTANDLVNAKPPSLQPGGSATSSSSKEPALAFVNPAFKHSTGSVLGMQTSPRRVSEGQGPAEYTPLPNKFNSLNLRGRNKKTAIDNKPAVLSPPLKPYHRDHPLTGPHKQHSVDLPLTSGSVSDHPLSDSEHFRDEKRYGCAKFPMELYPETSTRPAPDGSNSVDSQANHHSIEVGGAGDRPGTPPSWAGSQMSLNSQQTGIRNLQKSIDETSKIKQEYEAEVTILRGQLTEAQSRLSGTETRLAYQADQTNQVMEDWKIRLDKSEERLRAQQHEKDEQIKNIIQRLLAIEEDLRQEQQEMKSAISRKEQIIDSQERRIRELDAANNKLQKTLTDMKDRVTRKAESKQQTYKTTLYVNDYNKSSFC